MAVGSSMLATIRTAPPQWAQVVTSMEKTRLSRCAQLIARRFCSGLRGSSWALASTGAASPAGRLPRPDGVTCARRFAFGANTPWKRVRCARGGGTSAASLAMKCERFAIGGLEARVIAVPGHTSDSNAFLIGDALFTGDSLFMPDGGTARCDFPGGDAATLYRSIQRLYALPDATRVFVCHDYAPGGRAHACETRIGEQKRANIHVRADTPEADFVALREARDATLDMAKLILPAVQVNIRAGALPAPESNGTRFLRIPLDTL